MTQFGI